MLSRDLHIFTHLIVDFPDTFSVLKLILSDCVQINTTTLIMCNSLSQYLQILSYSGESSTWADTPFMHMKLASHSVTCKPLPRSNNPFQFESLDLPIYLDQHQNLVGCSLAHSKTEVKKPPPWWK